ncbi:MAG TPA: response regulator [Actinomycetota bacterium]|nr:response regulator [Actinomycetota bacterium]
MNARVLVVDDNADLKALIVRRVEAAGHEIVGTAGTGPEALAVASDGRPDVVVLDYQLPGMSGEDVARELRVTLPGVKIIAFSGVAISKPYWADGFVPKTDVSALEPLIQELVDPE